MAGGRSSSDSAPRRAAPQPLFRTLQLVRQAWLSLGTVQQIVACACGGACVGVALNLSAAPPELGVWLGMPGTIYLRLLTLLVAPLVFCSVVQGVASLNDLGVGTERTAVHTAALYVVTTVVAVLEGLAVTYALHPLWRTDRSTSAVWCNSTSPNATSPLLAACNATRVPTESIAVGGARPTSEISDALVNLILSMTPRNMVGIFVDSSSSPNMLGMIVFAGLFGSAITVHQRSGKPDRISPIISDLLDVTTILVMTVASYTPPAVGALVCSAIAKKPFNELAEGMRSLGVVVAGCIFMMFFHVLVFQTALFALLARASPWVHLKGMGRAAVVAFGTASSAVTLPTTIDCCEALGYTPSLVRFVLSLGATISMDGTAMYYGPVVLWLADHAGVEMGLGNVTVLAVISTLSSMGAAPTPGAGTALMVIIWATLFPEVPLPPEFAYYLAVDWLVDRFRTLTNVMGDSFVTGIINSIAKSSSAGAAIRESIPEKRRPVFTLEDLGQSRIDSSSPAITSQTLPRRHQVEPAAHEEMA
ncbi:hypothetical protein AB1Y20_005652 [Prymnesium parvum]|uniref:Amino acid transporter n=1 Tax=Prymnesium parvum TaxID=97485 RepID=A0AB34J6T0_PRYPA